MACSVGVDITFEQLKKENEAILIAVGLAESHSLPIPGTGESGSFSGRHLPLGRGKRLCPQLGKRALVSGAATWRSTLPGGKTAGPEKVYMACLESREEMPAWKWEVAEAEEEGIEILNSWGPKAILEKEGAVAGIEFRRSAAFSRSAPVQSHL